MLRLAKILLIAAVCAWGAIGAFHNLSSWQGTLNAVTAATSMSTFEGGSENWQATDSMLLAWLGALFIVLSKMTAAVLCAAGAAHMWRARHGSADDFNAAKTYALTGCAIAVLMLFGGFIVVAETLFELWRSEPMRGTVLDSAFRYAGMIALVAIFVGQRDD